MNNSFEYNEMYSHPYSIALNLTNDCNLACKYCFVEQKPEYMTLDIAKQAVDYAIKNLNLHKTIYNDIQSDEQIASIWFFGGEPLLCFNSIIKPLIDYCEKQNYLKDLRFSMTTNGTLLDKEKVDFLKKYNIYIMLSIDGDPETQDYQRPCKNSILKSSELLEKNIPYILKQFPLVIFRSTIYQPTIQNVFKNYLYAESLGFKAINFTPDTRQTNWTQNDYNNLKDQLYNIFAYRMHQYQHEYYPMCYIDIIETYKNILYHDINIINNYTYSPTYIHNCGLGTFSAAIDYKGDIYTCQERPSKQKKDMFLLGNLNTGINQNYHKIFIENFLNEVKQTNFQSNKKELCNTCLLKDWCVKNCISVSKDLYNNYCTINENYCLYHQILLDLCIKEMDILVNQKNKIFYLDLLKNNADLYNIFEDFMEENYNIPKRKRDE